MNSRKSKFSTSLGMIFPYTACLWTNLHPELWIRTTDVSWGIWAASPFKHIFILNIHYVWQHMHEVMTTDITCDSGAVAEEQLSSTLSNSANKFHHSWLNPKTLSLHHSTCKGSLSQAPSLYSLCQCDSTHYSYYFHFAVTKKSRMRSISYQQAWESRPDFPLHQNPHR